MTKRSAADVSFFLIDGLDMLGTVTELDDRREAKTEESHTLGDSWAEHSYVGNRMGELTQQGFYDDAAGAVHDALSSGPGQSRIMTYGLEGTATGARFVGFAGAMEVNYHRQVSRDALTKAKATYKSHGPVEEGRLLHTWKAAGTTGQKASVNGTASSTGGAAYLQYAAASGECNVRIVHSSDDLSFATLFTFTKTSVGHGSERLTTTGTIERYTAVDFTTASATGKISVFNAMVGLVRGLTT